MAQITLTRAGTTTLTGNSGDQRIYVYYGFGQDIGNQPITVTSSTNVQAAIAAISFTGVSNTGLDSGYVTTNNSGTSPHLWSAPFTTANNNAVVVDWTMDDAGMTTAVGSGGTTMIFPVTSDMFISYKPVVVAGATTLDGTLTLGGGTYHFLNGLISLNPNGSIAYDNSALLSTFSVWSGAQTNSFTSTGTNLAIVVFVAQGYGGGDPAGNADVITSVTVGTNPVYTWSKSGNFVAASSQYLTAPSTLTTDVVGPITVEGWIKPTGVAVADTLLFKGDASGYQGYQMYIAGGFAQFSVNGDNPSFAAVAGTIPVPNGIWTHVAGTADGTDVKLYVNGVLDGTTISSVLPTTGTFPIGIGGYIPNGVPIFYNDGDVGLVRLWSIARTGPQLLADRCNVLGPTTNLNGEWILDGTLSDNSGNGNTLTNINGVTFPALVGTCPFVTTISSGSFFPQMIGL
jgi:hypothetical protein